MGEAADGRLQRHERRPAPRRSRRSTRISSRSSASAATASATTIRATAFSTKCSIGVSAFRSASPAVYLEIGRRAGLRLEGVNFPGHFLVRAPGRAGREDLIVDPFHAGALLSEVDCRHLLREHVGDEAAFDRALLATATRQHIVVRMLVNLKRLYVRMRSFPQARAIADLLLAVDPSALSELRDRGLLAYHMEDFAAALRDLEAYLRLMPRGEALRSASERYGRERRRRRRRRRSRRRSGST